MIDQPTKYILYCAQEANFQIRSMLIPYDKIMNCSERAHHLEILRKHSKHNVKFAIRDKEYIVENLLLSNYIFEDNIGRQEESDFSEIINDFTHYADVGVEYDFPDENGNYHKIYLKSYDDLWADEIICDVTSGFNCVASYCDFRTKIDNKLKPIEIVEGFLVLESYNGKLRGAHPIETVDEMYQKYYS